MWTAFLYATLGAKCFSFPFSEPLRPLSGHIQSLQICLLPCFFQKLPCKQMFSLNITIFFLKIVELPGDRKQAQEVGLWQEQTQRSSRSFYRAQWLVPLPELCIHQVPLWLPPPTTRNPICCTNPKGTPSQSHQSYRRNGQSKIKRKQAW